MYILLYIKINLLSLILDIRFGVSIKCTISSLLWRKSVTTKLVFFSLFWDNSLKIKRRKQGRLWLSSFKEMKTMKVRSSFAYQNNVKLIFSLEQWLAVHNIERCQNATPQLHRSVHQPTPSTAPTNAQREFYHQS
jgi:hypothetical protein